MQKRRATYLWRRDIMRLEKVKEYINAHMEQQLKIENLAKIAGMGASTFRRHFIIYYEMPIHQYVLKCRMEKAMELVINSRFPIKQIASLTGFKNRSAFTHAFTDYFGHSPLYYL